MKLSYNGVLYEAELTTEHSASSYGIPVLVIDGEAYGPGDFVGKEVLIVEADQDELEALAHAGYSIPLEPWGTRLRRLRMEAGLSQAELGEKVGLSELEIDSLEQRWFEPQREIISRLRVVLPEL